MGGEAAVAKEVEERLAKERKDSAQLRVVTERCGGILISTHPSINTFTHNTPIKTHKGVVVVRMWLFWTPRCSWSAMG